MVLFRRKNFNEVGCFKSCHFDLVWWVKAEWNEHVLSIADLIQKLGSIEVSKKPNKFKTLWVWKDFGLIEVNIDGYLLEISRRGGIRRVFRDSEGKILVQFGKEVSVDSITHA